MRADQDATQGGRGAGRRARWLCAPRSPGRWRRVHARARVPALAVKINPVAITVDCGGGVVVSQPAQCKATVEDKGASERTIPEGEVSFESDSQGTFSPSSKKCELAPAASEFTAACEVTYTPTLGPGEHKITASYEPGETPHEPGSNSTMLKVALRGTAVSVSCGPAVAVLAVTKCTFTVADEAAPTKSRPPGSCNPWKTATARS